MLSGLLLAGVRPMVRDVHFGLYCCHLLITLHSFLLGVYVSFAFLPGPSNPLVGTVIDAAVHTHIGESLKSKVQHDSGATPPAAPSVLMR